MCANMRPTLAGGKFANTYKYHEFTHQLRSPVFDLVTRVIAFALIHSEEVLDRSVLQSPQKRFQVDRLIALVFIAKAAECE